MSTITHLYRYPIKGMSPEILQRTFLKVGETIPLDRCFALAHGTTEFNPEAPQHLSKTHFLMLMKNERLAALNTIYNDSTGILQIFQNDQQIACGNLKNIEGQKQIEKFFAHYLGDEIRGTPKLVQAPSHSFSDVDAKVLSCINLASVRELEKVLGTKLHPLRFRANVYFEGASPWEELDWVAKEFRLGTAKVRGVKRIQRCAATNVNPQTAKRDLKIPRTLLDTYGHPDLGIYMEVVSDGEIAVGDKFMCEEGNHKGLPLQT
ncbi:MAG: MOSC domain-containing protein [Gammaproteobacteria bacterium]|nr:MAG: MOSC domain-containing protein [Gammaproteobacteria bacterium]RKZ45136.1 MAG: MOSC domain-containing protein [Gammaproteobacteria bacterium]RKZ75533.1 MAG: MOSC domain-containing protein [Gammaproteobacteria bacterium]